MFDDRRLLAESSAGIETELAQPLLNEALRARLDESRLVHYEEYGEKKVIGVELDGIKWSFARERGEWSMSSVDASGGVDGFTVSNQSDIEFLNCLNDQDITHRVRAALLQDREIEHRDHGETKVVMLELDGIKYEFRRSSNEYANWSMSYERAGDFQSSDIREPADVEFLEDLFASDLNQKIKDALLNPTLGYDETAGQHAITVTIDGEKHCFTRVSNEYADWSMSRYSADGGYITSMDVRQSADVELLERLEQSST